MWTISTDDFVTLWWTVISLSYKICETLLTGPPSAEVITMPTVLIFHLVNPTRGRVKTFRRFCTIMGNIFMVLWKLIWHLTSSQTIFSTVPYCTKARQTTVCCDPVHYDTAPEMVWKDVRCHISSDVSPPWDTYTNFGVRRQPCHCQAWDVVGYI